MLNDIETKLLYLALDKGAYSGEADNAAIMLIRKLRERNVSAEEFIKQPEIEQYDNDILLYGQMKMPFGQYKNEMIMNIPTDYLIWVLRNCQNIKPSLRNAIENVI
jgi:hypothetical protein